jgi:membrane-associated phospholipid phosphatase
VYNKKGRIVNVSHQGSMDFLHNIEIIINIWLQALGGWIQIPAKIISFFGTADFYLLIMPILYWCVEASLGLRVGLILVISSSLNGVLKLVFHTPRPYWIDTRVKAYAIEPTFGLPSGHAQNGAAIWGLAAVHAQKRWFTWLCGVAVFLIGVSRLVLGVHFLSDLVLGWAVGAGLLCLFTRFDRPVFDWLKRQPLSWLWAFCALSSAALMLMLLAADRALDGWQLPTAWVTLLLSAGKQMIDPRNLDGVFTMGGIWLGLTGGAVWLFRIFGGFQPQKNWIPRALSYLVGLAGVLVLWYGLGAVFPRNADVLSYFLRYARYFMLGAWISAGAPWLFKRLGLVK